MPPQSNSTPTNTTSTALVVDDEADIRELFSITLNGMGINTIEASHLSEAHSQLDKQSVQLCFTDLRLPDGNGIELVKSIQQRQSPMPVAVISAHGNMEIAIDALKAGAFDFVSKPVDVKQLRALVKTALKMADLTESCGEQAQQRMLGNSEQIHQLRKLIKKLTRSQAPVFISGESGTGKELAARLIHESGPRAQAPFIAVNCGAIPSELMESEFFGHKRGSFTGATQDRQGFFQAANGGTLFLDEVADLPLHMQVKLLRAIQERQIRRVGDSHEMAVDVRILSATHHDLQQLVEQQAFRRDLFYRINVIELPIPPLRERPSDIPMLAENLINTHSLNLEHPPALSQPALEHLQSYSFPGNIRELENIIERAITLCEGTQIEVLDLRLPQAATSPPPLSTNEIPADLPAYLEDIERGVIETALQAVHYNKTAAAKRLGLSFRALRYRLEKLGIDG